MHDSFTLQTLIPHISWEHFYHPWHVASGMPEAENLKADALRLIHELENTLNVNYMLEPFRVKTDCDDMWFGDVRVPFLRRQVPDKDGRCLCLTDYVNDGDVLCVFATTVQAAADMEDLSTDPYRSMLLMTISDRLAEAAAEQLQTMLQDILTPDMQMPQGTVIRPAVGYPSIPDMSINFLLDGLCDFSRIGIKLTENGMMRPHSSVSGLFISHPLTHYFAVGPVSEEQVDDYARRRGYSVSEIHKYIYA